MGNIIRNINALASVNSVKPEEELIISDNKRPKRIKIDKFIATAGTVLAVERSVNIIDTDGAVNIGATLPNNVIIHEIYLSSLKEDSTGVSVFVDNIGITMNNDVSMAVPKYGTLKIKHFPNGGILTLSVSNIAESTVTALIFYSKYIHI